MRGLNCFLSLIIFYYGLQCAVSDEERPVSEMVKEIPAKVQLFTRTTLKNMPHIEHKMGYFTWPSEEEIATRLRRSDEPISEAEKKLVIPKWISPKKETVTEAKRMAAKWIRAVLQDRWIPSDLDRRLIALDSDINGYDAIRVRYEIDGYFIQIVQTNIEIALTIKPVAEEGEPRVVKSMSEKQMRALASETIKAFLNESEKIEKASMLRVESFPGGLRGKPDQTRITGASNQWWGWAYWWTDGETVAFSMRKFYGGAGIPVGLPKDWF